MLIALRISDLDTSCVDSNSIFAQQLVHHNTSMTLNETPAKIWGRARVLRGGCTVASAGAVGGEAEGALAWCRWLDAPSRTGRRLRHSLRSPAGLVSRRDPATSTGRCFAFWSRVAVVWPGPGVTRGRIVLDATALSFGLSLHIFPSSMFLQRFAQVARCNSRTTGRSHAVCNPDG